MAKKASKQLLHNIKGTLKKKLYPFQRLDAPALFAPNREKTIEMVFDRRKRTGGFVDRVKGMMSCLEIAHITGRTLIIHIDDSFPIYKLLDPGSPNVRFETKPIKWSLMQSAFHVSNDNKNIPAFLSLGNASKKQVFADTNLDYLAELHPGESEDQLNQRRARLFSELFQLKPEFKKAIEGCVPPQPIAIHSRFTSLLGDFKDVLDRPLDEAKKKALIDLCCSQVLTLAEQHPDNSILLFSDSKTFLDACCALSPRIKRLEGNPMHVDHASDPNDALYKTLLDFFVMVRCDAVYLLLNKPMYNSNFSRYAAIFGGKPFTIQQ